MKKKANKHILKLKNHNESKEMDFELNYLLSLPIRERFRLIFAKSGEIRNLMNKNGHGKTPKIIERT